MCSIDIVVMISIIFGAIIIGFLIAFNATADDISKSEAASGYFVCFVVLIIIISGFVYLVNKPTALNVYQDKTKLQINGYYQDSIFIIKDSTVTFK